MTGSLHVGLAALGAAIGVGSDRHGRVDAPSAAIPARPRRSWSSRFWPSPSPKRSCSTPCSWCSEPTSRAADRRVHDHASLHARRAEGGGQVERDRPHVRRRLAAPVAQIVSFGIVCAVLYALAYKPILQMLEARRQQIAHGLANAEKIKAELARIEAERQEVLAKADAEGKQLIEEARAAAARVQARGDAEGDRRGRADPGQGARGRRARARAHAGRAQARGRPAGRADHRRGHRQDPDAGRSAPARGGDGQAAARRSERGDAMKSDEAGRSARRGSCSGCASSTARSTRPRAPGRAAARRVRTPRRAGRSCRTSSGWCGSIATGTRPSSRARRRWPTTCATSIEAGLARMYGPGLEHVVRGEPGADRRRCASRSAATSTTAASGRGWRRSRHGL